MRQRCASEGAAPTACRCGTEPARAARAPATASSSSASNSGAAPDRQTFAGPHGRRHQGARGSAALEAAGPTRRLRGSSSGTHASARSKALRTSERQRQQCGRRVANCRSPLFAAALRQPEAPPRRPGPRARRISRKIPRVCAAAPPGAYAGGAARLRRCQGCDVVRTQHALRRPPQAAMPARRACMLDQVATCRACSPAAARASPPGAAPRKPRFRASTHAACARAPSRTGARAGRLLPRVPGAAAAGRREGETGTC